MMQNINDLKHGSLTTAAVWLMMALSSIVFFQPAPYDFLGLLFIVMFFATGLRLPTHIGFPLCLLGIFLVANIVAGVIFSPIESAEAIVIRTALVANWLMFTCLVYKSPHSLYPVIWHGYITAACIATIIGIGTYLNIVPMTEIALKFDRVRGTFKDPNVFGPFLIPPCVYLFSRIDGSTKTISRWLFIPLILLFLGIVLSFSRGAWIATAASFGIYLLLRYHTDTAAVKRKIATNVAGIFLAALLTAPIAIGVFGNQFDTTIANRFTVSQSYDIGRFGAQRQALALSPVFPLGVGPAQSPKILDANIPPHNVYLHVLIETGWIGAAALYAFLILTLVKGAKACLHSSSVQTHAIIVFSCIVGLLVQSLFIDTTHWRHLYLLLGLMWGSILHARGQS